MAEPGSFDFFGETFGLVEPEDMEFAALEFAATAGSVDEKALDAMGGILRFLQACVVEQDWQRFLKTARSKKAQIARDLMPIVADLFTGQTARPTRQPSGSSDGLLSIVPSSTDGFSSQVIGRLNASGRDDLAQMAALAQEARATA